MGGVGTAGALTVKPICELCERVPETPVSVRFTATVGADEAAVKVMSNGEPGLDCSVDGEVVIPLGKPASENVTAELKPFSASTVTEIDAVPASVIVTALDESDRAKSGDAGAGDDPPPLPHPARALAMESPRRIEIRWTKAGEITQVFTTRIRVMGMAALGKVYCKFNSPIAANQ